MIGRLSLRRHRAMQFALAVVLVAAVAVTSGWRAGHRAAAHLAAAAAAPWALPEEQRSDAEADAAILRARRPWGGTVAFRDIDGSPPPPPVAVTPPWRLVGTVLRGDGRFALIEVGPRPGGKLEYRGIGERLPDHSLVLQIEFDSITAEGGAGVPSGPIVYRLFQKKS